MRGTTQEWATLPDEQARREWVEERARVRQEREARGQARERELVRMRSAPMTPKRLRARLELREAERAWHLAQIEKIEREGDARQQPPAAARSGGPGGSSLRPADAAAAGMRARRVVRPGIGTILGVR